jgi:hypothetical protein
MNPLGRASGNRVTLCPSFDDLTDGSKRRMLGVVHESIAKSWQERLVGG